MRLRETWPHSDGVSVPHSQRAFQCWVTPRAPIVSPILMPISTAASAKRHAVAGIAPREMDILRRDFMYRHVNGASPFLRVTQCAVLPYRPRRYLECETIFQKFRTRGKPIRASYSVLSTIEVDDRYDDVGFSRSKQLATRLVSRCRG